MSLAILPKLSRLTAALAFPLAIFPWSTASTVFAQNHAQNPPKPAIPIVLDAATAKVQGPNAQLQPAFQSLLWLTKRDTSIRWQTGVAVPGKYRVEIEYSLLGDSGDGLIAIAVGEQVVRAKPAGGGGLADFQLGNAGEVAIDQPGKLPVIVKPVAGSRAVVMNLRSVSLVPASIPSTAANINADPISPAEDGSLTLSATEAEIEGTNARMEGGAEPNIGFWEDVDTSLGWVIRIPAPGSYRVVLDYSLPPASRGGKAVVRVGDQTLKVQPRPGKGWSDYKEGNAGEVTISEAGEMPVEIRPVSLPHGFLMNLRSVTLLPVETLSKAIDIADRPISPSEDGSLNLTATNAEIDGRATRLEGGDHKYIVWWSGRGKVIRWPVAIPKPGRFEVCLTYSLASSTYTREIAVVEGDEGISAAAEELTNESSGIELTVGNQILTNTLKAGKGWDDFQTVKLGTISIENPGDLEVVLSSPSRPGMEVMHLKSLDLVPERN